MSGRSTILAHSPHTLQAVAVSTIVPKLINTPITVCSTYNPPRHSIFSNDIHNLTQHLRSSLILCGDFNGHSTWGGNHHKNRGNVIGNSLRRPPKSLHNYRSYSSGSFLWVTSKDRFTYLHVPYYYFFICSTTTEKRKETVLKRCVYICNFLKSSKVIRSCNLEPFVQKIIMCSSDLALFLAWKTHSHSSDSNNFPILKHIITP